jgi:hypothetical protein
MRRSELVAPQAVLLAALPPLPALGGECQRHWQRRATLAVGTRRRWSPVRAAVAATRDRHPPLSRLSLASAAALTAAVGALVVALPPLRSPRAPSFQAALAPSGTTPAPPAARQASFDFPQTTQVPLGLSPAGQPVAPTPAKVTPAVVAPAVVAPVTGPSPAAASPPASPSGLALTQPFPTPPEPTAAEAPKGRKHGNPNPTNTGPVHDPQDRQGRKNELAQDHSANSIQV